MLSAVQQRNFYKTPAEPNTRYRGAVAPTASPSRIRDGMKKGKFAGRDSNEAATVVSRAPKSFQVPVRKVAQETRDGTMFANE
jgi:hypothetical protein